MKTPEPQAYLNEEAQAIYWEIGKFLEGFDAIESVDSLGLSMMAFDLWLYHEAADTINKEGATQIAQSGYSQITGHFTVMKECKASFLKYSQKFGLSPKDRELMLKFKVKKDEGDALDDI